MGSPMVIILSRINPIARIDIYLFKIHSNIVLPSTPRLSQMSLSYNYNINYLSEYDLVYLDRIEFLGSLGLCGIPFSAGFYSKHLILGMFSLDYVNFLEYFLFYFCA